MKKVLSISLALLMLVTNIGISFNAHYCGGIRVEQAISFGSVDLDCGMHQTDAHCDNTSGNERQNLSKSCCKNVHQTLNIANNFETTAKLSPKNQLFVQALAFVLHTKNSVFLFKNSLDFSFKPPLPRQDYRVLFQSFLI